MVATWVLIALLPSQAEVEERVIATVPENWVVTQFAFSADGRHVMYALRHETEGKDRYQVGHDDRLFDRVREIELGPVMSGDGQVVSYAIRGGGSTRRVVRNGEPGPEFADLRFVTGTPTGVAYMAKEAERDPETLFIDHEPVPGYERVWLHGLRPGDGAPVFTGIVAKGGPNFLHVGDLKVGPHMDIGRHAFSPDGSAFAYAAADKEGRTVILGETRFAVPDSVSVMAVSRDGKSVAYACDDDGGRRSRVFVNDRAVEVSCEDVEDLDISDDGSAVAFVAKNHETRNVYFNGKAGPDVDAVAADSLTLSGNGQTLAYVARDKGRWYVVVGETFEGPFDDVQSKPRYLSMSPDGRTLAYTATPEGGKRRVYVGGSERPLEDGEVGMTCPILGPDGVTAAYFGILDQKARVTAGTKSTGVYDQVDPKSLRFSDDGKQAAFGARAGRELRWVVLALE